MCNFGEILEYIRKRLGCDDIKQDVDAISIFLSLKDIKHYLLFLRDDPKCRFEILVDIFGVDYPNREKRFELVYNLLSVVHNIRLRIKCNLCEKDIAVSVSDIFSAASWFEREVFDMYGIEFSHHPDLRRILTDYGFKGNPMLKDFPLTGYEEVSYSSEEKRIVSSPIDLQQDFRMFNSLSPWRGKAIKASIKEEK